MSLKQNAENTSLYDTFALCIFSFTLRVALSLCWASCCSCLQWFDIFSWCVNWIIRHCWSCASAEKKILPSATRYVRSNEKLHLPWSCSSTHKFMSLPPRSQFGSCSPSDQKTPLKQQIVQTVTQCVCISTDVTVSESLLPIFTRSLSCLI